LFNLSLRDVLNFSLSFDNAEFLLFQMDRLFPPHPTTQLVLRTWARDAPGFPAVQIALLTRLGYRWYPEYMVHEDYREFNQEQYHADVRIYDQQDDSDTELHLFHGIGVTIEMAVHNATYSAVARLRGEFSDILDDSEFRYIPYAPVGKRCTSEVSLHEQLVATVS
jgi:hypothetical protein